MTDMRAAPDSAMAAWESDPGEGNEYVAYAAGPTFRVIAHGPNFDEVHYAARGITGSFSVGTRPINPPAARIYR